MDLGRPGACGPKAVQAAHRAAREWTRRIVSEWMGWDWEIGQRGRNWGGGPHLNASEFVTHAAGTRAPAEGLPSITNHRLNAACGG